MTLHSAIEYLKYRWGAKNRHGVHSPFAYAFVELIENRHTVAPADISIPWPCEVDARHDALVKRVVSYYAYNNILQVSAQRGTAKAQEYDLLLFGCKPEEWLDMLHNNAQLIGDGSAVILTGIHRAEIHTTAWEALCADSGVRMSMDLFDIGLLFFRKEFKTRQHFILKGPQHS
jgi:hypothetical protein